LRRKKEKMEEEGAVKERERSGEKKRQVEEKFVKLDTIKRGSKTSTN
jgi:hypothetical protein